MASTCQHYRLVIFIVFSTLTFVKLANQQLVNIADDKPAAMSSVSDGSDPGFAVDGNMTEDSICSQTNSSSEGNHWWRLDLTESLVVRQIDIRLTSPFLHDTFNDTQVYVTNVPEVPDETYEPCQLMTGRDNTTNSPDVMEMKCDMKGQYVVIVKRETLENSTKLSPLELCEVSVFVCMNGTYGQNCSLTCGQCREDDCDAVSGVCPGTCEDGYTGSRCDSVCQSDLYGPNCSLTCGQCGIEGCDHVTGSCNGGCKNGYTGNLCKTTFTTADTELPPLAAGGVGAAIGIVVTLVIVAVIIVVICCCMTHEKKAENDMPTVGVNAVRYGRNNETYQDDAEHNNTSSLDRTHQYEELDARLYQPTSTLSRNGNVPTVILTPSDEEELTTSSTDPHYLFMSGANQHLYEEMDGHVTKSVPDDVVNPDDVVDKHDVPDADNVADADNVSDPDDVYPQVFELPEPSFLEKSLGGNSYITMSELNTYENTQM